jgi:signal-transduction protein with cAMP-binding, CBS, and nucleotidyltransferase domain
VGFDWAWLLLFPRDLAHMRTEKTDRVSHAHYAAGDYIFRQGDAPTNFYVVEQGEVEIVRPVAGTEGEVVAVLGPGSFFGERALLNHQTRAMSVRARGAVEVLVLGKNVFAQMSGALAPLKEALAQALNRRAVDPWKDQPEVQDLLQRTKVRDLMEPAPAQLLPPTTTMGDVGKAFVEEGHEFFFVSADGKSLDGVVTITDLLRGRAAGATNTTPISEFMTKNPVAVAADDSCAVASATIREYRLKTLPVLASKDNRQLAGCLRIRRLMAFVLQNPGGTAKPPAGQPLGQEKTQKTEA